MMLVLNHYFRQLCRLLHLLRRQHELLRMLMVELKNHLRLKLDRSKLVLVVDDEQQEVEAVGQIRRVSD